MPGSGGDRSSGGVDEVGTAGVTATAGLATADSVTTAITVGLGPDGVAVNPAGTDAYVTNYGAGSVSVVALAPTGIPGIPARPTATDGDHQATVAVTDPAIGGDWIPTSYTVTAFDTTNSARGGQTCTVTGAAGSCTLTGLNNGDRYAFTATATNPGGTSRASSDSNPVTPSPPADIALTLTGPAAAAYGTVFTENLTVTDLGPSNATDVATNFLVPAGLTVNAAARRHHRLRRARLGRPRADTLARVSATGCPSGPMTSTAPPPSERRANGTATTPTGSITPPSPPSTSNDDRRWCGW